MSEDRLQQQIVTFFNNKYCLKTAKNRFLIFAVPNGGSRNIVEAKKLKQTGVLSGVSDLIIVSPNKTTFVELKLLKGVQSKTQKDFESRVNSLGFDYVVIRSLEDFKYWCDIAF